MILPDAWGAPGWFWPALIAMVIALPLVWRSIWIERVPPGIRMIMLTLKMTAFGLMAICLMEPLQTYTRPVPGANDLVIMVDRSQSLGIRDAGDTDSRGERMKSALTENPEWQAALAGDFRLRRYEFDTRLIPVNDFGQLAFDGLGTSLSGSLQAMRNASGNRPVAGVLLVTDGIDVGDELADRELAEMPPIFPIVAGSDRPVKDIAINQVASTQTNFESAPVTLTVDLTAVGFAGETIRVELLSKEGDVLQSQEVREVRDGRPFAVRFQLRPEEKGVNVFRVVAQRVHNGKPVEESEEATLVNNERTLIVDRGRGPFRILYVGGRPNWEYKFMRRAIADDFELELVGLLRVARKEPKFTFRGRDNESTNPLYRGFGNQDDATAEQFDEAVMIRLDTNDEQELRDGFPKSRDELFQYDAIIIDDLEADFFSQDQKTLIQEFVSRRGGGLLMLGGVDSFAAGGYDRTPIGEMLPVYLDGLSSDPQPRALQLNLTREGWIQPWVRLESNEQAELERLRSMPEFRTVNVVSSIKPGATVLANVETDDRRILPALAVQRFGKGNVSALLLGDLWRWQLKSSPENDELTRAWRQTLRWLVSEVPRRVEVATRVDSRDASRVEIETRIRGADYLPQLNAEIDLVVTSPSGREFKLTPEASDSELGLYRVAFVSLERGAYQVAVSARTADGEPIDSRWSGWVSDPAVAELQTLVPDRKGLERLAAKTGGAVLNWSDLPQLGRRFENRKVPMMETDTRFWWHRWSVFLVAVGLLVAEWGLRRLHGLS